MIKLIPSVYSDVSSSNLQGQGVNKSKSWEQMCQLFCAELVKSLVRSEKNQQVMSQVGLTEEILENCSISLADEHHYLHQPIHYAFERVATHSLTPKDLRRFLRLGNPLNCERSFLPPPSSYGAVPLSRVKSLVSMTTPKSSNSSSSTSCTSNNQTNQSNFYSNSSTPFPSFIEFDMSAEGFGCLFLPSIAPNGYPTTPDFSSATLLATGMGMGERGFPGNLFCKLFCVFFSVLIIIIKLI
jgi:hypothetical protein